VIWGKTADEPVLINWRSLRRSRLRWSRKPWVRWLSGVFGAWVPVACQHSARRTHSQKVRLASKDDEGPSWLLFQPSTGL